MSKSELNQLRKRNIKKILIIIFSIAGNAAIITVVTLLIINTDSGGGWPCLMIGPSSFISILKSLTNNIFEEFQMLIINLI